MGGVNAKKRYSAALPADRTGRGRDTNPLCRPELKECWNKLPAMNFFSRLHHVLPHLKRLTS
jgi:hypothetical protein